MLVETARPDGTSAQIVFRLGGNVTAAALEQLCAKVRLAFLLQRTLSTVQPPDAQVWLCAATRPRAPPRWGGHRGRCQRWRRRCATPSWSARWCCA